jgi:hypothetical protein
VGELCAIVATSHSPMLVIPGELWPTRADGDRELFADRWDAAVRDKADLVGPLLTSDALADGEAWCAAGLRTLSTVLAEARPDVVVVVGDDQDELLPPGVTFPVGICAAETVFSRGITAAEFEALPDHRKAGIKSHGREVDRTYRISKDSLPLALALADAGHPMGLVERQLDGTRMGHAFTFVVHMLLGGNMEIPILPVMLTTFLPRVQPSAADCLAVGAAIGACLTDVVDGRIAVVGSGGLSHRMVDPELDDLVVDALLHGHLEKVAEVPEDRFTDRVHEDGNGEIKNWLTTAALARAGGWVPESIDYRALYRTRAGTGVGAAFGQWRRDDG